MGEGKYNLSFIGGGLLLSESIVVAEQYLDLADWSEVENKVMNDNLLQSRTVSTSKRFFNEIRNRLLELNNEELQLLVDGIDVDRRQILWAAVCRRYKFIRDFAVEVLAAHHHNYKTDIDVGDYSAFFNEKAQEHPELDRLASSTSYKVRQILFKLLREAGMLSKENTILAATLSLEIKTHLNDSDLLVFPISS